MSRLFQDWSVNAGNSKGRIILIFFRFVSYVSCFPKALIFAFYPILILYRVFVEWLLGVELPWRLKVGPRLRVYHGMGLVVNDRVVIGSDCILRHSTTIGVSGTSADFSGQAPVIGNDVDIGAGVIILGGVHVGDHAIIGAGSVVVHDVPKGAVVVGNPARVLRIRQF